MVPRADKSVSSDKGATMLDKVVKKMAITARNKSNIRGSYVGESTTALFNNTRSVSDKGSGQKLSLSHERQLSLKAKQMANYRVFGTDMTNIETRG